MARYRRLHPRPALVCCLAAILPMLAACAPSERERMKEELAAQEREIEGLQSLLHRLTDGGVESGEVLSAEETGALIEKYEDFSAKLGELEQNLQSVVEQYDVLEAENKQLQEENARLKRQFGGTPE